MLHNEGDPATDYPGAYDARTAVSGDVKMLLVDDMPGHGPPFPFDACAAETTVRYLTTGHMPADDVHCQYGPIRSGEAIDDAVYEFENPASPGKPLSEPYSYRTRDLSKPALDETASAPRAARVRIADADALELLEAVHGPMATAHEG